MMRSRSAPSPIRRSAATILGLRARRHPWAITPNRAIEELD